MSHVSVNFHEYETYICRFLGIKPKSNAVKKLFEAPSLLFSHGPQDLSFINAILHAHTEYKYYMPKKKITFVLQQEHHLFNS